ncbi:MAG TPA: ferritin family protein, partial [Methanomicrobiales archaeon]|nr:ferritin family protein [Methanomicrobiales archaeon]
NIDYFVVAPSASLKTSQPFVAMPSGDVKQFQVSKGQIQVIDNSTLFKQLLGFNKSNYPEESYIVGVFKFAPQGIYPVTTSDKMKDALNLSMHEESHANLVYLAYADAARNQSPLEAQVWETIGAVELEDHFAADARMAGAIQDTQSNLKTAIATEQQTIKLYDMYAKTAQSNGDQKVASTFQDLAQMERNHLNTFQKALTAMQNNQTGTLQSLATANTSVSKVPVKSGSPQAQGQVLADLDESLKLAAYEHALYYYYARMAVSQAQPEVGAIFYSISQEESEHAFNTLGNLAGAVSPRVTDNLVTSVAAEREANNRYVSQSHLAQSLDENVIALQLYFNGYMETGHGDCYQTLLLNHLGASNVTPGNTTPTNMTPTNMTDHDNTTPHDDDEK